MDNPKSPGESPKQQAVQPPGPVHRMLPTPELIRQMLEIAKSTSDVIFSPGRAPMAEVNGQLLQLNLPGINVLTSEDTARIAADVIGGNQEFVRKLREEGSCDLSYAVAEALPLPREHFHAARKLRDRNACNSQYNPRLEGAEPASATGGNRRPAEWDCSCDRTKRIGKIIHARGHRGQHQRT